MKIKNFVSANVIPKVEPLFSARVDLSPPKPANNGEGFHPQLVEMEIWKNSSNIWLCCQNRDNEMRAQEVIVEEGRKLRQHKIESTFPSKKSNSPFVNFF